MDELLAFANYYQGAIVGLATISVAIVGVVTAVLTFHLARENRLLRKAGTEPEVVAYLTTDQRYKNMVNLALANIGQGPARNVTFAVDCDEADFTAHSVAVSNKSTRTAIGALPQGEKIVAFFGAGHELFAEPRLKPFSVRVYYEDVNGDERVGKYELDVSQFDGLITLGSPAEHEIAEALKKIERHFSGYSSGFKRLKVETITTSQVREEREKQVQRANNLLDNDECREQSSSPDETDHHSTSHDQLE